MTESKEWFATWFDTKYYHILYQDRNDEEAQFFMRNLLSYLKLSKDANLFDLPCGKGRHAKYLNELGYSVLGADLSKNSIDSAKEYETENLKFRVHDMREPFQEKFDAILNLFTSFGYFNEEINIKVLKNLKNGLKKKGVLVIDFMNVEYVKQNIIASETVVKSGIEFKLSRTVTNDFIQKEIRFVAEGKEHCYTESVRNISLEIFEKYIEKAGLRLRSTYGDYALNLFNKDKSKRLILILE